MITVSAPGKIHLMGEHVVVYGKAALLTAINLRAYVTIQEADKLSIESSESDTLIRYAIELFQKTYHIEKLSSFLLKATSSIPPGCHLGSSAAISVATLGALHAFFNKGWNVTKINELAYEVEKKQHGNPSGGDNTAVTFGGFVWFRKEFEFLKSMWQLPFKISGNLKPFVLINSGRPVENTGEMVGMVKGKVESGKWEMEKIFNEQEKITKRITIALKEGDEGELMQCIKEGERNLEAIGVVGEKAKTMIQEIEHVGGSGKILGGGGVKMGSGILLVYHPEIEKLTHLAKNNSWELIHIMLGEEGIRKEIN